MGLVPVFFGLGASSLGSGDRGCEQTDKFAATFAKITVFHFGGFGSHERLWERE